ncbi:MAG: hypothetical protein R2724_19445 [Bryobacterales bacterium]
MFLGHIGVGLAAKKAAPRVSLGWLIAAPTLLDLLWPIFLLVGWESVRIDRTATVVTPLDFASYPISHSLAASIGWGVLLATIHRLATRQPGSLVVGALVPSHWVLDWIVHRPDLPLYPGGAKYGLGLWNSVPATIAAEAAFFGDRRVALCAARRASGDAQALWLLGFWFIAFPVVVYAANLAGPPPESAAQIATVGLAMWLFPLWAWAFDQRRRPV